MFSKKAIAVCACMFLMAFTVDSVPYKERIRECLAHRFQLEQAESDLILSKIAEYCKSDGVIHEFLELSQDVILTPLTEQTSPSLSEYDAVIAAPKTHNILFENDVLRILETVVSPGETVPFHTHQWGGLDLIFQGSLFEARDLQGNLIEVEACRPGVERSIGNGEPYVYTNVGTQEFQALLFECKR